MASNRMAATTQIASQRLPMPHIKEGQVDETLQLLLPVVDAIGQTIGPHCEVVLHDLRNLDRSIVAISNGVVSGRQVGGPVVGGPMNDVALRLLGATDKKDSELRVGYRTQARDGRELKSTSLVLRTPRGKPVIALCINVDLSAITMARALLEQISRVPLPERDESATPPSRQIDVEDVVSELIQEVLNNIGKPPKFMDREDRLRAVALMHERGLFLVRGGVERAAAVLGISRFTLYSYLKEVHA